MSSIRPRDAERLARAHREAARVPSRRSRLIRRRIRRLGARIDDTYRVLHQRTRRDRPPGSDWLLDNEYLVRETARTVLEDLPPTFWRRLPRVAEGERPRPRIEVLARAGIDAGEGPLEVERIAAFVARYQTVLPLTLGELWALPAFLRLLVLEDLAAAADRLLAGAPTDRPEDPGAEARPIADRILSLRALRIQDWKRFVEPLSHTEATLRRDPAGFYAHMDFATRDRYRSRVERLARTLETDEVAVAEATVHLAAKAQPGVERHVGYYLLGAGREHHEQALGLVPSRAARLVRFVARHAVGLHAGSVGLLAALLVGLLGCVAHPDPPGALVLLLLLAVVPAIGLAVAFVNWIASLLLPPRVLPKLDFEDRFPDDARTIIAIPALVTDAQDVHDLLTQMETAWLADPAPAFTIVLLSDLADAAEAVLPGDEALIRRLVEGVRALNRRYGEAGRRPFRLLHRARRFNPREGVWMGWERKRGKLESFLALCRGAEVDDIVVREGSIGGLQTARYVITLDADTFLPRGAARRLVGTMAHPLNRPRFDEQGRIRNGYTVMQPRVESKPGGGRPTICSHVYAGDAVLDLYTHAVSEAYQDLFGEGIYAGKGILDIDGFRRSLEDRVPEDALLSHDLFEGIHGRAALVNDVVVLEGFPSRYRTWLKRMHRWIRGDWQLLPWLGRRVPTRSGERVANRLSFLDRFKILDNLRRSLGAPFLFLLLVAGWWLEAAPAFTWFLLVGAFLALPFLFGGLASAGHLLRARLGGRSTVTVAPLTTDWERWALALVFLPQEAWVALDAVLRVLWRLFVSHRHLLQWVTAAQEERAVDRKRRHDTSLRFFWPGPAAAIAVGALLAARAPGTLPGAAPMLAAWLLAPAIATWISRPRTRRRPALTPEATDLLRRLARRTHLFFEQVLGPDDHWLPPDNVQEEPKAEVAHRTSPTNIGLALLSTLSAYDLGYVTPPELATRLGEAFETLGRLERHRGHFLNWYDTATLAPLEPRYVSTVDSGNLAGALLALPEGLRDVLRGPVCGPRAREGLLDTVGVLEETVAELTGGAFDEVVRAVGVEVRKLSARIGEAGEGLEAWRTLLDALTEDALPDLDRRVVNLLDSAPANEDEDALLALQTWIERLHRHVRTHQRLLDLLAPWCGWANTTHLPLDDERVRRAWERAETLRADDVALEDVVPRAHALEAALVALSDALEEAAPGASGATARAFLDRERENCRQAAEEGETLTRELEAVMAKAGRFARAMDFGFLYDAERHLFRIGHNLSTGEPDPNHYDLLASEARLASLVAIAHGEVPPAHWQFLGRPFARLERKRVLLSWGGTMFEYCMPFLLTKNPEHSLLAESGRAAVAHQIAYARREGMPWGVSEAGFHAFDAHRNYQYRSFGVPGLGLKRDLDRDRVVTPYATALALTIAPEEAVSNFQVLIRRGLLGPTGFFESLDLRPAATVEHPDGAIVRERMAHHQGMILTAIANHLLGDPLVRRFHAQRAIRTVEPLLYEQTPTWAPQEILAGGGETPAAPERTRRPLIAHPVPVPGARPHWHLLGNGRYAVLLSSAGSGTSRHLDIELTAFEPDPTNEGSGTWIYVRDLDAAGDDALFSATYEPTRRPQEAWQTAFAPHRVEFRGRHGSIDHQLMVFVPPDEDVEVRRLTLVNEGEDTRQLLVTSFAEVVLAPHAAHAVHPAFSKLFLEAEYIPEAEALVFVRRPREPDEHPPLLGHTLRVFGATTGGIHAETSRRRFLGRGGTARRPAALIAPRPALGGVERHPLDPILALGTTITLPPGGRATLLFATAAAHSRDRLLRALERATTPEQARWALERARDHVERRLDALEIDPATCDALDDLLSTLVTPLPALRPPPDVLARNVLGRPGLWPYGISGTDPILLVHARRGEATPLLLALVRTFAWWRSLGFAVDLVVVDHRSGGYVDPFRDHLLGEVRRRLPHTAPAPGEGLTVLRAEALPPPVEALLAATARAVLEADGAPLRRQLAPLREATTARLPFVPIPSSPLETETTPPLERPRDLRFDNGLGGFTPDGRAYVIHLEPGRRTPAPWTNVIANPRFGFLVTESGASTTWALNSGLHRLSPWPNDPVTDPTGEVLYLRDEETGAVWTPTPAPAPSEGPYQIRHAAGTTTFRHHSHGLVQELTLFAARDDPVKVIRLRLHNTWARPRRLTATYYVAWVLGTRREETAAGLVPEFDPGTQSLLVRSPLDPTFAERTAFLAADRDVHGLTTDRREFLGRLGDPARPEDLVRVGPSGRVEAGCDPCGVLQIHIEVPPRGETTCHFVLGEGEDRETACALARRWRDPRTVREGLVAVERFWEETLGAAQVETPDPAMDLLLNRWLPYQALSCRLWGRTALYQSSGAIGFRDQLQDTLAFLPTHPELARAQILQAAAHQFTEGDVLHWWHPPGGHGVRTRCSDDLVWLPYVTACYVQASGDDAVLDESVPWLVAPPLEEDEQDRYGRYDEAPHPATLEEHCLRALERAARFGEHGLPLIGAGDWNDGLNRVGRNGQGESVWLGWFLAATCKAFAPLLERRGDAARAHELRATAHGLIETIDAHAWDGGWYRRAWFDDGTPLGSSRNDACRIDAIAQAWAVLAGGGDPARARRAMAAVEEHLVRPAECLVLLLSPPFGAEEAAAGSPMPDPGYIAAYPPGIRENGGQYTHAAAWVGLAFADLATAEGDASSRKEDAPYAERAETIFRLLNPIYRTLEAEGLERYRVEPYILAADIAGPSPHVGRGGWTWYTGSAAWCRRLGLEGILGLRVEGGRCRLAPCIPRAWKGYRIDLRRGRTTWQIHVENPRGVSTGVATLLLDGSPQPEPAFPLEDDGHVHEVRAVLGPPAPPANSDTAASGAATPARDSAAGRAARLDR